MKKDSLRVALAQLTPQWLDRDATHEIIKDAMQTSADGGADLLVFGEAFWPGYPFWLAYMDGAAWELKENKSLHAHYLKNSIAPKEGHLDEIIRLSRQLNLSLYLGFVERAKNRGGHSLYCSLGYIDPEKGLCSVHRKLQPTYDERLTWSPGDGNGLRVHKRGAFHLGGLNCWENWMPLVRASLYAQGANIHVAVWPGSDLNTRDITRFIARESRSYVISVSSLMNRGSFPDNTPYRERLVDRVPEVLANGGSCIANPDGTWLMEPRVGEEGIFMEDLSLQRVYEERQNFDPSGHYSRPDVTRLVLDRTRQSVLEVKDPDN